MKIKNKYALIFFITLFLVVIILIGAFFYKKNPKIFSLNRKNLIFPSQSASPTIPIPTPTIIEYTVEFVNLTKEITQGENATFTWTINGPKTTIKTTTVYYNVDSSPGKLTKDILPLNTKYSNYLKEFINGEYVIPLTFVGNSIIDKDGTYYARAYASIDNNNYWSDEYTFTVKPAPGHKIEIINFPEKVKLNENSAFTWQISGPAATTPYTAIVGGKDSKSEILAENVKLSDTPYKELVKEFISGSYQVPLNFIGNSILPEYGTYYIRALAVINGKNIWSDEYKIIVE